MDWLKRQADIIKLRRTYHSQENITAPSESLPRREKVDFRMSVVAIGYLNFYSEKLGISRTAVLELSLRALAEKEGLEYSKRDTVERIALRVLPSEQRSSA